MNIFYFFGDSITLGVNVTPAHSFVNSIYTKITEKFPLPPTTLYNLGVRKNTTRDILMRFEQEFSVRNFPNSTAHIFIMCGVVDTVMAEGKMLLDTEDSLKDYEKLLLLAKEKGNVYAISPTPVANDAHKERIFSLANEQEKIAQKHNIPYLNITKELDTKEFIDDLKDAIHPNEIANALIADKVINHYINNI